MKTTTRKLTTLAMLAALSVILVALVHIPFPPAPFLEYDPADVPIFIGTFLYGPAAGLGLTLVASVIQGTTVSAGSGIIGIIMHLLSTGTFVVLSGSIYRKYHNRAGAAAALVVGVVMAWMGRSLFQVAVTICLVVFLAELILI